MQMVILLAGLAALCSTAAYAQTDVAASLYGAFNGTTNGNDTIQSPSNAAGGLLEVRRISKPWVGYEGTYAFNRANQAYSYIFVTCPASGNGPCAPCNPSAVTIPPCAASVPANAHEVTGDWVASVKIASFRPFALAGGGILFNVPTSGQITITNGCNPETCTGGTVIATNSSTKPVFVYGAGVDWKLIPHIGLRFQYRGNLYKAPNLTTLFYSTGAFTHTAEPMIGVYFRL
jgi:opacity protein-like surface antigen